LYGRFFASIFPLIYFYIQHKVHRIPGGSLLSLLVLEFAQGIFHIAAYTHYSFFEWALIVFDVAYDSIAELDFREADLQASGNGYYSSSVLSDIFLQIALGPSITINGTFQNEMYYQSLFLSFIIQYRP